MQWSPVFTHKAVEMLWLRDVSSILTRKLMSQTPQLQCCLASCLWCQLKGAQCPRLQKGNAAHWSKVALLREDIADGAPQEAEAAPGTRALLAGPSHINSLYKRCSPTFFVSPVLTLHSEDYLLISRWMSQQGLCAISSCLCGFMVLFSAPKVQAQLQRFRPQTRSNEAWSED